MCDDIVPYLLVEGDPGIPLGELDNPFAGLADETARTLSEAVYSEDLGALLEGKAVGTAQMGGDVARRDARMRYQIRANVRHHIRQAGTNANRELKKVTAEARRRIRTVLKKYLDGDLYFTKLIEMTTQFWADAYTRTRNIGRKASGVERFTPDPQTLAEEEKWFRGAVREELRYWNLFMEEVKKGRREGTLNEDRMWHRFDNYLKALRFMFESARVVALPPQMLLYWMGPKPNDPTICPGCIYMMERSPFTKNTIPAVPRDGSTPCLTNCRHRIVVRVAHDTDIQRRTKALPIRESMVKALKLIKEEMHGTGRTKRAKTLARRLAREKPRSANPFKGMRVPKNLTIASPRENPPVPDERKRARLTEADDLVTYVVQFKPGIDVDKAARVIQRSFGVPAHMVRGWDHASDGSLMAMVRAPVDVDVKPSPSMLKWAKAKRRPGRRRGFSSSSSRILGMTEARAFKITKSLRRKFKQMVKRISFGGYEELHDDGYDLHVLTRNDLDSTDLMDDIERDYNEATLGSSVIDYDDDEDWQVVRVRWRLGDRDTRRSRGMVEQILIADDPLTAIEEAAFDFPQFKNIDLYYVAKMLADVASQRPVDRDRLEPILDRLMAGLEQTVLAVKGRPEAMAFSTILRRAVRDLWYAFDENGIAEGSDAMAVLAAMAGLVESQNR